MNDMSSFGNYYYQVVFNDGRVIRRRYVSKKVAQAAHLTFTEEMILLNVQSVTWGEM